MMQEQDSSVEYMIVAEDSAPNRTILAHLLSKLGYQVLSFENGDQAWNALCENKDKKIVAVLSDIMMPVMDGLELLRRVRSDNKYAGMPFVLITAVSDQDYIHEAKNLKCNGYILKPVTIQRVSTKLKDLFPGKQFPGLAG
jgi:two-component system, chemotaxis family, chemotaxis protein CheY